MLLFDKKIDHSSTIYMPHLCTDHLFVVVHTTLKLRFNYSSLVTSTLKLGNDVSSQSCNLCYNDDFYSKIQLLKYW